MLVAGIAIAGLGHLAQGSVTFSSSQRACDVGWGPDSFFGLEGEHVFGACGSGEYIVKGPGDSWAPWANASGLVETVMVPVAEDRMHSLGDAGTEPTGASQRVFTSKAPLSVVSVNGTRLGITGPARIPGPGPFKAFHARSEIPASLALTFLAIAVIRPAEHSRVNSTVTLTLPWAVPCAKFACGVRFGGTRALKLADGSFLL
eukprot:gene9254-8323_t